jgi:eukaryotic-like serine/threonine-protein kinase
VATILSPGERVNGYEISRQLNTGAMAISYAAKDSHGEKVFLKQYKSPSVRVPWYKDYVKYQKAINERIKSGVVRNMVVTLIDAFEAKAGPMTYFQVFEFVEGGENLDQILQKFHKSPAVAPFDKRLIFAKVIMSSINALHQARVIHCDLKPENLQLFKDAEIRAGYRLKLIDTDFSIMPDRRAPWHGSTGYVGTPGYLSPEHIKGDIPTTASDIFTCGVILYELLSESGHPYIFDDEGEYKDAALSCRAPKPVLPKTPMIDAAVADIAAVMHRCLSPDSRKRPTAQEILEILNGGKPAPKEVPKPIPPKPAPVPPAASTTNKIVLTSGAGSSLSMGIRTNIGKYLCRGMGPDAQYLDELQFTLDRNTGGQWMIVPNAASKNETLVNGKAIKESKALRHGDVIGVGRESKGIIKLPLKVELR